MYRSERLLTAIGNLDDEIVETVGRRQGYLPAKTSRPARRKLWRTLLAAAIIASLLGCTAYAVGVSIHAKRQEQLRQRYQVEENAVTSYAEYALPEAPGPSMTLLSSYNDGTVVHAYVDISPVPEDEVRDMFMFDTEDDGLVHYLAYLSTVGGGEALTHAAFFTQDWEFAPDDYVTVTQADGTTRNYLKPEAKLARYFAQSYDAETQTLTLDCRFWLKDLPQGAAQAGLHVFSQDVWARPDENNNLIDERSAIHRDFGTIKVDIPEPDTRKVLFAEPLAFTNPADNCSARLIGVELSSGAITWLLTFDEEVLPYLGDLKSFDGEASAAAFERQRSWVRRLDALVADASVTLSDGRVIPVPGAAANSGNQESPFRLYGVGWEGTIPVADVVSVRVSGQRFDLPRVAAAPLGG